MKKFVTLLGLSLMMAIAGCSSQTTAPEGEVSYPNIADELMRVLVPAMQEILKSALSSKMVKLLQSMWWKVLKHWRMGLIKCHRIFWIMAWKQMPFLGQLDHQKGFVQQ